MSSDAEMASPNSTPQRSNKSAGKKKVKEPTQSPDPEGSDNDSENYDIEKILDAKKGYFHPRKWAFLVKWENYGEEENSWVDEGDFNQKDMIAEFWQANPNFEGNPLKNKTDAKGRKSNASSVPVAVSSRASTGKNHKSNANEDEALEEASAKEDEEVRRPKKRAKLTPKKNQPHSKEENGFFSPKENPRELGAHDANAMAKYMHHTSWEKIIVSIETIERSEDGSLMVYFTAKNGEHAICSSSVVAQKAPLKLISFYETHLRWKQADQ